MKKMMSQSLAHTITVFTDVAVFAPSATRHVTLAIRRRPSTERLMPGATCIVTSCCGMLTPAPRRAESMYAAQLRASTAPVTVSSSTIDQPISHATSSPR